MGKPHSAWTTFNATRPKPKLARPPIGKVCRICRKKFKGQYTDGPLVWQNPDGTYEHMDH